MWEKWDIIVTGSWDREKRVIGRGDGRIKNTEAHAQMYVFDE